MKIFIHAKPGAREENVVRVGPPSPKGFGRASEAHYVVSVKEPPVHGRANAAIVKALVAHFNVPVASVHIISGHTSRQKVVEIDGA